MGCRSLALFLAQGLIYAYSQTVEHAMLSIYASMPGFENVLRARVGSTSIRTYCTRYLLAEAKIKTKAWDGRSSPEKRGEGPESMHLEGLVGNLCNTIINQLFST